MKADEEKAALFFKYLHRRMLVNVQMHGTSTVLGKHATPPPHDDILDLVTSGNAYRHLDKADQEEGAAFRELVGMVEGARPSDEQFERLLMLCLLRMGMFNEARMMEWASQHRKQPVSALHALPCTEEEALAFASWLKKNEQRLRACKDGGNKMWAGAGNQVQGFRWVGALRSWFGKPPGNQSPLRAVASKVRAARTWEEANLAVQKLDRVGPYTGAQGLCTLLFGVCGGDFSLVFDNEGFDTGSLLDWCAYGPGPKTSIEKIFGAKADTLEGIRQLRRMADDQFKQLGIEFPYLLNADATPRPLTCVDLEHSLCYFCRYLRARQHLGANARKLHELVFPAICDGRVRRWKISQLADKSFEGAWNEALDKMKLAGCAPLGVEHKVEPAKKGKKKEKKKRAEKIKDEPMSQRPAKRTRR